VVSGTDSGAILSTGASQQVFGTAFGDIVSRGVQTVESGGTAVSATVSSGGSQVVSTHGTASGTIIVSNGLETISSGGTAIATTVSNGGHEAVSSGGVADATVISSGGTLGVVRGGTASGTTVLNGGHEIVSSGGFEAVATLNGSGTLEVSSGGTVSGIDFGIIGGTLQLDSLVAFGGTISGFQLGDDIDLRGLAFTSGKDTLSWSQSGTSGTLTVTSGAKVETLTLLGQYATADFSAATDGHGGTVITDTVASSSASQTPLVAHQ